MYLSHNIRHSQYDMRTVHILCSFKMHMKITLNYNENFIINDQNDDKYCLYIYYLCIAIIIQISLFQTVSFIYRFVSFNALN